MSHAAGTAPPPPRVLLGTLRAEDFGASSSSADVSGALNLACSIAAATGGGVILLDSGKTYTTRRSILLPSNVELVIPTGTTLKGGAGLGADVVASAAGATGGIRVTGGGTIDCNRASGQTAGNGITLTGLVDSRIDGVNVVNAYQDGVALVNCARVLVDVTVGANGRHGVYHSGSTFCRGQITARDNGQRVSGSGVVFDATSTDNAYALVCTDTRAGGSKTQQYAMLEVAASACDRNTLSGGSSLGGNATGTLSLIGASSGFPTAVPTAGSVTDASIAPAAAIASSKLAGYPWANADIAAAAGIVSSKLAGYPWANGDLAPAAGILSSKLAAYPWHNADLSTDVAKAGGNQLVNGGFELWQRGNGPFTTAVYTADRWAIFLAGNDTVSVSKDTTHQDTTASAACAAAVVVVGTGAGASELYQTLKQSDGYQLVGKPITASVRVRTSTANAVRLAIFDGTTTTYSSYHTGDGTYQTLTVTATPGAATLYTQLEIHFAASCTAYLDNAMLVLGSVAADYAPLTPAAELALAQRYYETFGSDSSLTIGGIASGAAQWFNVSAALKATKSVTPTVTKVGATWTTNNCGQPSSIRAGKDYVALQVTSTASGSMESPSDATHYFTAEANP